MTQDLEFFKLLFTSFLVWVLSIGCGGKANQASKVAYAQLTGETMGTYYKVTCSCPSYIGIQSSIDSLLEDINGVVSTYDPDSFISELNRAEEGQTFADVPAHFVTNIQRAQYWYDNSDGYFDVSIQPMVNYWGFGYTPKTAVTSRDSFEIDSLNKFTGLDQWIIDGSSIAKQYPGQKIGFGALAKGYAVDEVARLLDKRGCNDYLVDIGGDGTALGLNKKGQKWTLGISVPSPEAALEDYLLVIRLGDRAIASSGNYRNYHEVGGKKYGHTIDPKSGYPYQDELLGVSIVTDKCIDADAIATTCMAMGYTKAATFINKMPEVQACFLVGADDGSIQTIFANGFVHSVLSQ